LLECKSCKIRNKDRITIASFVDVNLRTREVIYREEDDSAAANSEHLEIISSNGLCKFWSIAVDESLKKPTTLRESDTEYDKYYMVEKFKKRRKNTYESIYSSNLVVSGLVLLGKYRWSTTLQ
jgi:hypothetical protein